MICFVCATELEPCNSTLNPKGALEMSFEGAYGSIHDGDRGIIYICDECFEEREARVFASHNYLGME